MVLFHVVVKRQSHRSRDMCQTLLALQSKNDSFLYVQEAILLKGEHTFINYCDHRTLQFYKWVKNGSAFFLEIMSKIKRVSLIINRGTKLVLIKSIHAKNL